LELSTVDRTGHIPENLRSHAATAPPQVLCRHFEQNLRDQGADPDEFYKLVAAIRIRHDHYLFAERSGFCSYDLAAIRDVLLGFQKLYVADDCQFPDPVGIKLVQQPGTYVEKGTVLASFRSPESIFESVQRKLEAVICTPVQTPCGPTIEGING